MNFIVLLVILVVVSIIYIFSAYNKFVTLKARIKASIQEIGNQLKRQADLIPNLVSSVKGYMKHEEKIFKDLTEARKMIVKAVDSGKAQKMVEASVAANRALGPIQAVFESNPELKAAGPTSKLMEELNEKRTYSHKTDIAKFLNLMKNEIGMPPYYYNVHILSKGKGYVPKMEDIIKKVRKKGYKISRTHFSPVSVKTNAPYSVILRS